MNDYLDFEGDCSNFIKGRKPKFKKKRNRGSRIDLKPRQQHSKRTTNRKCEEFVERDMWGAKAAMIALGEYKYQRMVEDFAKPTVHKRPTVRKSTATYNAELGVWFETTEVLEYA